MSRAGRHRNTQVTLPKLRFLGEPTAEREAKSEGFVRQDMGGGMVRSHERRMLTHPHVLQEQVEEYFQDLRRRGADIPQFIAVHRTPYDKAIRHHSNILWWYLSTQIDILKGKINIADYEGKPKSRDLNGLPITPEEFKSRKFFADMQDHLPSVVITYMEWLAKFENPELSLTVVKTRVAYAKEMWDKSTEEDLDHRYATGSHVGVLWAFSQIIAEAAQSTKGKQQREKELEKIQIDHRKKMHYA